MSTTLLLPLCGCTPSKRMPIWFPLVIPSELNEGAACFGKPMGEASEPPTTPCPGAQAPLPATRPGAMQPLSELLAGPCDWIVRAVVFAPKPFPGRDTGPDKTMLSAHAAELKSVSAKAAAIAFFMLHLQQIRFDCANQTTAWTSGSRWYLRIEGCKELKDVLGFTSLSTCFQFVCAASNSLAK